MPDDFASSFGSFLETRTNAPPEQSPDFSSSFGGFLDQQRQKQASLALIEANRGNPDQAARAQSLAGQTGLPADTVERNLPDVESQVKLEQQQRAMTGSPFLAAWAADVSNAKVAHDDFDQLSWIEQKVASAKSGFGAAWDAGEKGALTFKAETGGASAADIARHDDLAKSLAADRAHPGAGNWFAHTVGSIAGMISDAYVRGGMESGLTGAGIGATIGGGLGVVGGPGAPATIPAGTAVGAATGFTVGTAAGTMARFFESAYGNAVDSLRQISDSSGRPLDEWTVQGAAILSGVVNAALMGRTGSGIADAAESVLQQGVREMATRPTLAAAIGTFGRSIVGGLYEGAKVGTLLEGTNVIGEQFARLASSGDFATILDDPAQRQQAFDRILQSALEMSVAVGAMHGLPAGANLVVDSARARRAQSDAQFIDDLANGAASSRLRERSPDAFRSYVAGLTDGSPVEALYIPAERVRELYQNLAAKPGANDPIFGFVPDMPQQLEMALGTGGDIRIPTADYAAHLAGSEIDKVLHPDIRVGKDGLSQRDVAEAKERAEEIFRQRAEEWRREIEADTESRSPAGAVFGDVLSRLRQIDVAPAEADVQARFWAAHYDAWADRFAQAGDDRHDAWTLYQRAQARFARDLPDSLKPFDTDALIAARADDGPSGPDLLSRPPSGLDSLIDELRGTRTGAGQEGPSLAQFIARRGGIADTGGELKAMDADTWHIGRPFSRKLVRRDLGKDNMFSPDDVARAAWEAGYFPETQGERPTPDHLFRALAEELRGQKRFPDPTLSARVAGAERDGALRDLRQALDEMGIDLGNGPGLNNGYVRERIARWNRDRDIGAGHELFQDGKPPVLIRGDEFGTVDAGGLRIAATKHLKGLQSQRVTVENPDMGSIGFSGRSTKKLLSAADATKLAIIAKIEDIVREGRKDGPAQPPKNPLERSVIAYQPMAAWIRFGDRDLIARFFVREDVNGKWQYDLWYKEDPPLAVPIGGDGEHAAHHAIPATTREGAKPTIAPDRDALNLAVEDAPRELLQSWSKRQGSIRVSDHPYGSTDLMPVAKLKESLDTPEGAAQVKTLRQRMFDFYRKTIAGKTVAVTGLGDVIFDNGNKIKSTSADPLKVALIEHLPDLLRTGTYTGAFPHAADSERHQSQARNIKQWHRVENTIEFGGETYRVGMTIREDTNGTFHYNVNLEEGPSPSDPRAVPTYKVGSGEEKEGKTLDQRIAPDQDDINLSLMQSGAERQGSIRLPPAGYGTGPHLITLFQSADRSTLFHESAHLWLQELIDHALDRDAPAAFRADLDAVTKWMGIEHWGQIGDREHEQFARGFEAYLIEGKAPSPALEGVFARVRSWLVNLYSRLVRGEPGSPAAMSGLSRSAGFDVALTPEIRAVMDRMLASDDQIALTREAQGLTPLFRSAQEAGLSDADFARYQALAIQARDRATLQVERKAIAELQREKEAWWKEESAKVREQVQAEIDSRPDIQALHYFRTGTMLDGRDTDGAPRLRLSERAIVDRFGTGILADLPGAVPKIVTRKDGIDPDLAAELFGMRSGDELIRSLVRLKTQEDQVKAQGDRRGLRAYLIDTATHDRMVERHGDMLKDGTIVDEALDAVHGEPQAEVLAAEVTVLRRLAHAAGRRAGRDAAEPALREAQARADWDVAEARAIADWRVAEERERGAQRVAAEREKTDAVRQRLADAEMTARWLDAERNTAATKTRAALSVGRAGLDAMRAAARKMVGETEFRHLDLNAFARAEAKAGREVERAVLARDYAAAALAKQRQLLNHLLYAEARRTREEIDKAVSMMGRIAAKDTIKGLDQGYLDQAHALLERFDFRPASQRAVDRRESLAAWIIRQEELGNEVAVPDALRDEAFRLHYTRLPVDDLRGLADAVRNINHLGRLKQELLDGKAKRDFEDVVKEALGQIEALPRRPEPREAVIGSKSGLRGSLERLGLEARRIGFELMKAEEIIDRLDYDNPEGVFNRIVFRPIKEALFREFDLNKIAVERFTALGKSMPKGWDRLLDQWFDVPMLTRDGETMRFRKRDILGLALNWGNDSNRGKLLEGYGGEAWGWSRDNVAAVLDRHMTEHDWRFVQGIWDTFGDLYPDIAAMQKRLTGVEPDKIEAVPVTTRFGIMPGGYFPMIYDPKRSDRAAGNIAKAAADALFGVGYSRATTPKGHTKSRSDGYSAPVDFRSLDLMPHRLGQHIHDLCFREAILNANKFLTDRRVRDAIGQTLGQDAVTQLDSWLRAVANDRNVDARDLSTIDRLFRSLRANTVAVAIAFRTSTLLKHDLSALSMSIGQVGAKAFLGASRDLFRDLFTGRRLIAEIMEKSGELRHRINHYDRDTAANVQALARHVGLDSPEGIKNGFVRFRDAWNHWGHMPVAFFDFLSTLPVWLASYRKGLLDGKSEADAIYAGDKAVRQAHGAQTIVDQAAIQRGAELQKLATMFGGFFNRTYNRAIHAKWKAEDAIRAAREGDWSAARADFGKVMAYAVTSLTLPALVEAMVAGHTPGDDDSWFGWAGKAILGQVCATVPVLRDLANFVLHGRDYEFSPVVQSIDTMLRFAAHDVPTMFDDDEAMSPTALKRALTAGGLFTGIGTGQLAQSAQYMWDVIEGNQTPEDGMEFLRALTLGPKPKEH